MLISIEADADLHHPSAVGEIGLGIAAGINLLKGMTRCVAHLQFHNVDGIGHEDDHIHATACYLHLCAHVNIEHGEDEVEGVFVEAFLRLGLGELLLKAFDIRDAGKVGLHVAHGRVDVALLECSPEF